MYAALLGTVPIKNERQDILLHAAFYTEERSIFESWLVHCYLQFVDYCKTTETLYGGMPWLKT